MWITSAASSERTWHAISRNELARFILDPRCIILPCIAKDLHKTPTINTYFLIDTQPPFESIRILVGQV